MEWLRVIKRRMFLPSGSPSQPAHLPRTALKCLWVFMFVGFYRSGQEPGAVNVWKEGRRGREDEVKEDEWRFIVNPIFIESNANETSGSRPASLQRPDYLINQRKEEIKEEDGPAYFSHLLTPCCHIRGALLSVCFNCQPPARANSFPSTLLTS